MICPPDEADVISAYFDSMRKVVKSWGASIDQATWHAWKRDCRQMVIDAAKHERQKVTLFLKQIHDGKRCYHDAEDGLIENIECGCHWTKLKDL